MVQRKRLKHRALQYPRGNSENHPEGAMRSIGANLDKVVYIIHATMRGEEDMWYVTDDPIIADACVQVFEMFKWTVKRFTGHKLLPDVPSEEGRK
jgi:hypothetical protein